MGTTEEAVKSMLARMNFHPPSQKCDFFVNNDKVKYNQGYDSDGETRYYNEISLDDDPNEISKDVIDPGMESAMTTLATTTSDMTTVAVVQLPEERAGKLKVPELKDKLKKRGKGMGGNKKILFD